MFFFFLTQGHICPVKGLVIPLYFLTVLFYTYMLPALLHHPHIRLLLRKKKGGEGGGHNKNKKRERRGRVARWHLRTCNDDGLI